jgi:hypothetical protein
VRGPQYCNGADAVFPQLCIPAPSTDFVCPAAVATCDATVHPSARWPTEEDRMFVEGTLNTTDIPFERRAVRRSSLDPCELVPAFDEVWSDGICAQDAWQWRPIVDVVHTLLGMEHLFRMYILETGGPAVNYKRVECDLLSYTNDDSEGAYWHHMIDIAKSGGFTQIIDRTGYFCSASDDLVSTEYVHPGTDSGSGQCQIMSGARYTIRNSDMDTSSDAFRLWRRSIAGRYIMSVSELNYNQPFRFSDFNIAHEMVHLRQNAHSGRKLYMEHGEDGECCTLNFEHMAYVTYKEYTTRLPLRFEGVELSPPWNGWRIDLEIETGFQEGWIPSWWAVPFPDVSSPQAVEQRWHVAAYVQSIYRLYTVFNTNGTYINFALYHFTCEVDNSCGAKKDPSQLWDTMNATQRAYYPFVSAIGFDFTSRLKNLATTYFIHKANQHQPTGFSEYEFWTYELRNPRPQANSREDNRLRDGLSEKEMFALAGYADRHVFLEDFHNWIIASLEGQRSPLDVADEITPSHATYVQNLHRLKERNKITEGPRCADTPLPAFRLRCDEGVC